MTTRSAWGLGLATVTDDGNTLDVWYPRPVLGDEPEEGLETGVRIARLVQVNDDTHGTTPGNCTFVRI